jgi:RNA polymerase sigma-70 factor (ECF subfamily)
LPFGSAVVPGKLHCVGGERRSSAGQESTLVDRARRGDRDAFAMLVKVYDRGLRALAFRLLGDREDMEDVLQEAYIKAFRGLPRFRGRASVGTWLYRLTYNACLDELKRPRRSREIPLIDAAEWSSEKVDPTAEVDSRGLIAAALASLPVEQRAAVLLVDGEGFSYDDAAEVLGVSIAALGSRLNRARPLLRAVLQEASADE